MFTSTMASISVLLTTVTICAQHSLPSMYSYFLSDSELREMAKNTHTGDGPTNVEVMELQESRDLDATVIRLLSKKRELRLRISPTLNLIKPNAVVRIINEDSNYEEKINPIFRSSFYHGYVDDEQKGSVSLLKTKGGWAGLMETRGHKYMLHCIPESRSQYLLVKMKPKDIMQMDNDFITANNKVSWKNITSIADEDISLRSSIDEFELEVGAYADEKLLELIKEKFPSQSMYYKLQEIILISLNTVHVFYQKPSIGNKVSVAVSFIAIIKNKKRHRTHNKEVRKYINKFCEWNQKQNPLGVRYDIGILFTGYELFQFTQNNTGVVGMAPLSGACKHEGPRSCAIIQTHSYLSALILVHEIGHNLGMIHDSEGNDCPHNKYIMAAGLVSGITDFSRCSRDYFKKYLQQLDDFGVNCLRNTRGSRWRPRKRGLLPGERVRKGDQCSLIIGNGFTENPNMPEFCKSISCTSGSWSFRSLEPPLPGTPCGNKKICYGGECQKRDQVDRLIASYKPTHSGNSREKLSLNRLCQKYAPRYPIGVDYTWKKNNNVFFDISNICSKEMLCYSPTKRKYYNYWEPAPSGTNCAAGKKCQDYKCQ